MNRFVKRRPSPALAIALVTLFIALGGTSYAAVSLVAKNSVNSASVINGSLQTVDLSAKAKKALKGNRGPAGPGGAAGPAGATGAAGTNGSNGGTGATGPVGATGVTGAAGSARAYGLVSSAGAVTRSKNVAAVTIPLTGRFCITFTAAAGIDTAQTGLVVSPYFPGDATAFGGDNQSQAIAEWDGTCTGAGGAPGLLVITGFRSVTTSTCIFCGFPPVSTVNNNLANEAFFFSVP